jgi:GMP synthase-like glutamine amidotransferase
MRVHVLQHVPFEGLGSMEAWLSARGDTVAWSRLFAGEALPAPGDADLLVVLGGPMSVNDEDRYDWLAPEKRCVAEAIAAATPVLGLCLGAQMIASALGAKVYPNREREIGWHPVERLAGARASTWSQVLPARIDAFHWHGETFDLPPGAVHLVRSAGCERQAFAIGERVLALQFHLETTPASARALIEHCPGDLAPGPFVQAPDAILAEPARFARIHAAMATVMERFAALARSAP